ncbi:MAG TPA: enolase C-terminal domain-like protein [Actinomycetes bacterium]|nr:enolase C-terminal domain-like protein [Actinomycetes bacterium]
MSLRTVAVRVPLTEPFQGVQERLAVLVEGPAGWGECSPFPGYPTDHGSAWAAAREAATSPWPAPLRDRVPVAAVIGAVEPERAERLALQVTRAWHGAGRPPAGGDLPVTVKVKIGRGDDHGRVAAVRAALGPAARIRVDGNGALDAGTAILLLNRLARYDLEFAEQPVATLEELAAVRRRARVPVAADESVHSLGAARRLAELQAADLIVLKVQPLGGVRAALAVAEAALVPATVGSLVETSVGLAAGLALAACLPELPHACGLGTAGMLAGDVVTDPLVPAGGWLTVRRPAPDPRLLARWAAHDRPAGARAPASASASRTSETRR